MRESGLTIARTTSFAAWKPGEIAFTSTIAKAIRRFGAPIAAAALNTLATAFRNQRLLHGSAIFGALVQIMSKPSPDFDADRLLSALSSQNAEQWGEHVAGITGGHEREATFRAAIMAAYERLSAKSKKKS